MDQLWIPITILAALIQSGRYALQKILSDDLGTNAVTLTRFAFGLPFSTIYLIFVLNFLGTELPFLNTRFLAIAAIGGIAQIFGTAALIYTFRLRNFAVGVTYSKTEALQTAVFGIFLFGAAVSTGSFIAIVICVVGVVVMSTPKGLSGDEAAASFWARWTGPAVWSGLLSGAGFAIAALSFREASLSLQMPGFIEPAAVTLVYVNVIQTVLLGGYMLFFERDQLFAIGGHLRRSTWIGLTGVAGSAAWFTAMTLQNAAYVRTLGQIELLFSLAISYFLFRERLSRHEIAGMALVIAGIALLVAIG